MPDEYPGESYDRTWRELVFPRDYRNPTPRSRYHLVVIGAGPAGLVTAMAAAKLGARVALVERQAMGGDCLNVGCVPSKALLEFTRRNPGCGADEAFAWLRQVRADIARHDSVERYRSHGVDVFLGTAHFTDRESVAVGQDRLRARRFVIATGARAAMPPIPGLASSKPLTNETLFDLVEPPKKLAVLGAGPIGCEMSQAMARLGVDVHLFELADRVLPGESVGAGRVLGPALESDGVTLHLGSLVSDVTRGGDRPILHTDEISVDSGADIGRGGSPRQRRGIATAQGGRGTPRPVDRGGQQIADHQPENLRGGRCLLPIPVHSSRRRPCKNRRPECTCSRPRRPRRP